MSNIDDGDPSIECSKIDNIITNGCETLRQLWAWLNLDIFSNTSNNLIVSTIRRPRIHRNSNGPKVILCHDYRFNYHERLADEAIGCHSFVQNYHEYSIQFYTFIYWSLIDIFIYFSHKFITIPPPEWIQACHRNGVSCFGTILVEEWTKYDDDDDDEQQIDGKQFLDKILANTDVIDRFITALVNIQLFYRFDGWLLNIETSIDPEKIPHMKYFIQQLKSRIKSNTLQTSNETQIIWYDSVTRTGKLEWQNELNDMNKTFFEDSDAIFLNYTWNNENLVNSRNKAREYCRQYDCYVGVDCYGRGCFGDGGLEGTWKAVKKILDNNLSVAIFAPGWTHESKICPDDLCVRHSNDDVADDQKHNDCQMPYWKRIQQPTTNIYSMEDEFEFWSRIAIDGQLLEKCEKLLITLPLKTCFNIGHGYGYFQHGQRIESKSWLNFHHHDLQPFVFSGLNEWKNDSYRLSISYDQPYNGGSSLKMDLFDTSKRPLISKPVILFRTQIPIDDSKNFLYRFVYKFHENNSDDKKWLKENLKIRTIINYNRDIVSDEDNYSAIIIESDGWYIRNSNEIFIDPIIRQPFTSYHQSIIDDWYSFQMCINLHDYHHRIILTTFQIEPYFVTELISENSSSSAAQIFFGEFDFDQF